MRTDGDGTPLFVAVRRWRTTRHRSATREARTGSHHAPEGESATPPRPRRRSRGTPVRREDRRQGAKLQLGGLVQAQTEAGDQRRRALLRWNDRALPAARAAESLAARFLEEFNFRAELELAGSLANTSALSRPAHRRLRQLEPLRFANVRVGQFKTPFGFEQLYHDPRLYIAERTLASDRLTPGRQTRRAGSAARRGRTIQLFDRALQRQRHQSELQRQRPLHGRRARFGRAVQRAPAR